MEEIDWTSAQIEWNSTGITTDHYKEILSIQYPDDPDSYREVYTFEYEIRTLTFCGCPEWQYWDSTEDYLEALMSVSVDVSDLALFDQETFLNTLASNK